MNEASKLANRPSLYDYMAYIAFFLGPMVLMSVLCFKYPDILTSQTTRSVYTEDFARILVWIGVSISFLFAFLCLVARQHLKMSSFALSCIVVSFLLGGPNVEMPRIQQNPFGLGLDWFLLSLFFTACLLVPVERLFGNKSQAILRPQWQTDLTYFFFAHALVQAVLLFSTALATTFDQYIGFEVVKTTIRSIPTLVQVVLAVFVADVSQSLLHRLYHRVPLLWQLHQIHHSVEHMDWLAGSRLHLGEILLTRCMVLLPLILLGFSQTTLNIYVVIVGTQAVLAHANVRWPEGVWENFVVLPRYHHWHHAKHKDFWDANYAIHTPLIDKMMGTFKLPKQGYPQKYGLLGGASIPTGFFKQHLYALKRQKFTKVPKKKNKTEN